MTEQDRTSRVTERKARQKRVLDRIRASGELNRSLDIEGIPKSTFENWKSMSRAFKEQADLALASGKQVRRMSKIPEDNIYNPELTVKDVPPFPEFRRTYIGRPIPKHQEQIIEAWDDPSNLIVIVVAPPGAGKDTTAGDIVLRESVTRDKRVAWVMESADQSAKRLVRLERYFWDKRVYDLAPQGPDTSRPTSTLMDDFGLFKWHTGLRYPDGSKVGTPKWTAQELYFLGRDNEADPNIWATGIQGAMYGARIDRAVLSDIFTAENQISPAEREKQWSWLMGTFMSRLDESGRALFLLTRVAEWDNVGRLIDEFTGTARVVKQDRWYTKYANGVATIVIPAIQTDESGADVSYWPERFPLESYLVKGDERFDVSALEDDEFDRLVGLGFRRVRGLYEIRERSPALFSTMYQQAPQTSGVGEFPPTLLDHCDDYSRSWGVRKPGTTLVLGIDPARSGGAAWELLEWDGESITVIDDFYGENIGAQGLREKLLVDPITRWFPKYAVYEGNRESSVLEHPQVIDAAKASRTEMVTHMTHAGNRGVGELRVAAISFDMASGVIRFPAATAEDRARSQKLKEHFRNWDAKQRVRETTGRIRQHIPDDRAMAFWVAWVRIKEIAGKNRVSLPKPKVADITRRRWGYVTKQDKTPPPTVPTDLVALYYGSED